MNIRIQGSDASGFSYEITVSRLGPIERRRKGPERRELVIVLAQGKTKTFGAAVTAVRRYLEEGTKDR